MAIQITLFPAFRGRSTTTIPAGTREIVSKWLASFSSFTRYRLDVDCAVYITTAAGETGVELIGSDNGAIIVRTQPGGPATSRLVRVPRPSGFSGAAYAKLIREELAQRQMKLYQQATDDVAGHLQGLLQELTREELTAFRQLNKSPLVRPHNGTPEIRVNLRGLFRNKTEAEAFVSKMETLGVLVAIGVSACAEWTGGLVLRLDTVRYSEIAARLSPPPVTPATAVPTTAVIKAPADFASRQQELAGWLANARGEAEQLSQRRRSNVALVSARTTQKQQAESQAHQLAEELAQLEAEQAELANQLEALAQAIAQAEGELQKLATYEAALIHARDKIQAAQKAMEDLPPELRSLLG